MTSDTSRREPSPWLRALGACVLALMAGALVYAATIAVMNFSRIGV